jgi:hypothetical protein
VNAERAALAVGTVLVWAHVVDEIRIGEWIAVPAGLATVGLLAAWPRMRPVWSGVGALLLGLLWSFGALQYHVFPLLQGGLTWQNVSGLLQLAGGAALTVLGIRVLLGALLSRGAVEPGRW